MPVKLIQASKDLRLGISTAVEFLNKHGHSVDNNPNFRITEEQLALLVKEFGQGLSQKERDRLLSNPSAPEPEVAPQPAKKEKGDKRKIEEIKTEIPEEFKLKLVTKGKIDLNPHSKTEPTKAEKERPAHKPATMKKEDIRHKTGASTPSPGKPKEEIKIRPQETALAEPKLKAPAKEPIIPAPSDTVTVETTVPPAETPKAETTPVPEEVVVTPPTDKEPVAVIQAEKEEKEETPFRLEPSRLEPNIKIKGKIDLETINSSTRPPKKNKEEKKKERKEKIKRERQNNALRLSTPTTSTTPPAPAPTVSTPAPAAPTTSPVPPRIHRDASNKVVVMAVKPVLKVDNKEQAKEPAKDDKGKEPKRKRGRIKKSEKIDINTTQGVNERRPPRDDKKTRLRKPVKVEVSEEEVQKQVKETYARLTSKGNKSSKGAKYRRDKRDAALQREHELMELEKQDRKVLKLTEFVTANDLANMMDIPVTQVIATCMNIDIMVSINQRLDAETINIVAEEFGFRTEYVSAEVVEAIKTDEEDNEKDWTPRPPIVTVMGHVDHGKTSLLDNIRSTNVIAGEAGGITQHIGAYNVKLPRSGRRITFLDTPGHEAFTAMRARGAKITDIAIIVVAADDNVMPQTVEAINHASAANVPIVFAINKIDRPSANPEKIKEELANMNYLVEDWGGNYQSQEISAKQGIGVEALLEKVLLEADLLELKANPQLRASGTIVESSLDKGRGYISTVLVANGTLKPGDVVLAGTHFGRIKAMFNERNQKTDIAGPSEPVLLLGLNGAPQAGDTFNVLESDQEAREIAGRREQLQRELGLRTQKRLTLPEIGKRLRLGSFQELHIIVKGDVDGSVEALSDSLIRLSTEMIQVNVIHKAVGQISESDVVLATASDAIIIGFQVRPSQAARRQAEKEGVEIRLYSVIYNAIEEVKSAMEGMLAPEMKEEVTSLVEIREVFKISKVGTVAGCMVKEGKIKRNNKVRLIRDGIVIYSGELGSLKRFKDDVKEVASGYECGLNINGYNDIRIGDMVEAYEEIEVKKTL
ncbi:MAG: translation initiation factor IF-2 [Tannerellaceae bacterium]|jgi:translation initiation factor IF-2|nr:translation initiation factor IF-2 [Tannerellaceae bacterium]